MSTTTTAQDADGRVMSHDAVSREKAFAQRVKDAEQAVEQAEQAVEQANEAYSEALLDEDLKTAKAAKKRLDDAEAALDEAERVHAGLSQQLEPQRQKCWGELAEWIAGQMSADAPVIEAKADEALQALRGFQAIAEELDGLGRARELYRQRLSKLRRLGGIDHIPCPPTGAVDAKRLQALEELSLKTKCLLASH